MSELNDDVAREDIRILRGTILSVMRGAGNGILADSLLRPLDVDRRLLREALDYLELAGLVSKQEVRASFRAKSSKVLWKITAKGIRVLEGTEEDGSVEFV